eukprot:4718205-Ditylum_brightwellii.AAC.1
MVEINKISLANTWSFALLHLCCFPLPMLLIMQSSTALGKTSRSLTDLAASFDATKSSTNIESFTAQYSGSSLFCPFDDEEVLPEPLLLLLHIM